MADETEKKPITEAPPPELAETPPRSRRLPPEFSTNPEDDRQRDSESRTSVSLGPLALLGFGPSAEASHPHHAKQQSQSGLLSAASLVIVIAALKIASPVLVPLTVSAFLATLTAPFVIYLKKKRVPPEVGVPVVVLLALGIFAGVAGVVVGSVNAFVQELPTYEEQLSGIIATAVQHLESWGFSLKALNLKSIVQPAAAMQFVGNTLSQVADLLSNTLLVLLMTIFVLFEALVLPDKIKLALQDPHADLSRGIRVVGRIKAYVVIKTSTSLATGVIVGVCLHLLGVDFALLWGLLAFLFNFIPNIGSIIAAVPAILLSLIQLGPGGALGTSIVFIATNMVIGSVIEPKIMGQRMNLSPLVVFISLVLWGWLWGPIGMLLSVPLTMATRIMLEGNESTRPFAILMAGAPTQEAVAQAARPPLDSLDLDSKKNSST